MGSYKTAWDRMGPHGIILECMETEWDCMGTVRDHMKPYGTLMGLHKLYTDQMAEWYRASESGLVDLGFDSESGQTKDYVPNDWKLLFDLLRHSIICVQKVVHSVPL